MNHHQRIEDIRESHMTGMELVEKYLNEDMKNAKKDWEKVIDVIKSVKTRAQLGTAHEMIKNFKRMYPSYDDSKLLDLEWKAMSRKLK